METESKSKTTAFAGLGAAIRKAKAEALSKGSLNQVDMDKMAKLDSVFGKTSMKSRKTELYSDVGVKAFNVNDVLEGGDVVE